MKPVRSLCEVGKKGVNPLRRSRPELLQSRNKTPKLLSIVNANHRYRALPDYPGEGDRRRLQTVVLYLPDHIGGKGMYRRPRRRAEQWCVPTMVLRELCPVEGKSVGEKPLREGTVGKKARGRSFRRSRAASAQQSAKIALHASPNQIVPELKGVDPSRSADLFPLCNRDIAETDSANQPSLAVSLEFFDRRPKVHAGAGPVDVIDVKVFGVEPPE